MQTVVVTVLLSHQLPFFSILDAEGLQIQGRCNACYTQLERTLYIMDVVIEYNCKLRHAAINIRYAL